MAVAELSWLMPGGVVATGDGADEDFSVFFGRTWPDLVAFCHTLTQDPHQAEEITQEALARVYDRYRSLTDPRPYAFRVASNLVRRAWRESLRAEPTDPAALPERPYTPRGADTVDAVRRLPSRLRAVVLLHYYADLPLDTVATLIHRPLGTVKRRLHEARAHLAMSLGEESR